MPVIKKEDYVSLRKVHKSTDDDDDEEEQEEKKCTSDLITKMASHYDNYADKNGGGKEADQY